MAEDRLISAYINPLAFIEVEEPWTLLPDRDHATPLDILRYLVEPNFDASPEAIVERYLEISQERDDRIFVGPRGVLQMLVWPLRYAKGSYALGNYLGSIALCGTVCEMASIFMFEASNAYWAPKRKGQRVRPEFAKYFKPNAFQNLRQSERTDVLLKMKVITAAEKTLFDSVRHKRNRHLHIGQMAAAKAPADAIDCFLASVKLVKYALGLGVKDAKLALRPEVTAWLDANLDRVAKD